MTVSSRTPEGEPGRCPVCGADVRVEPSPLFGDAICPNCGSLLWFINLQVFEQSRSRAVREQALEIVAEQLGVPREKLRDIKDAVGDIGADSLDMVELAMELEEEFGIDIPDDED